MNYTIKSFIQNLVGGIKILKALEEQENGKLFLIWDGCTIAFYSVTNGTISFVDYVTFEKLGPKEFSFDLSCKHYWYFTIKFSDKGIIKNKKYWLRDYIN